MTLKEVTVYVKTTRGVEYSTAVWKILRKKKKVRYGKPYIQNSKPECRRNPKKRVDDCLSKVRNPVIGFVDESAIQLIPNKRRVINTSVVKYKEGKKRSKSVFGFIALRNDVVMLSESCKSAS